MMLIPTAAAAFAAVLLSATLVQAGETKPAIVFDTGGKFDKSFNEGVANGALVPQGANAKTCLYDDRERRDRHRLDRAFLVALPVKPLIYHQ